MEVITLHGITKVGDNKIKILEEKLKEVNLSDNWPDVLSDDKIPWINIKEEVYKVRVEYNGKQFDLIKKAYTPSNCREPNHVSYMTQVVDEFERECEADGCQIFRIEK